MSLKISDYRHAESKVAVFSVALRVAKRGATILLLVVSNADASDIPVDIATISEVVSEIWCV